MQFNITFKTIFEYILKKLVLCIQIRFVSTEKTTRIASRASCLVSIIVCLLLCLTIDYNVLCNDDQSEPLLVYRPGYFTVHPPPAPSGPKFSNSENCCGSENAMPPKIFWDMEGHRGHFRSKNVFFFKKHILEKIHNKSHYFLKF